jgi:hypothetical protein
MYDLEVGTVIRLSNDRKKNGIFAGGQAIVMAKGEYSGYFLSIGGKIGKFHPSQIEYIVSTNESR